MVNIHLFSIFIIILTYFFYVGMNISHDSPGKDDAALLANPNTSELVSI
jgi:hypothetical protein